MADLHRQGVSRQTESAVVEFLGRVSVSIASARGLAHTAPMRLVLAAALLALAAPTGAQEPEIVVEAPLHRTEIERILEADNLDLASMSPREVAETMARIARGGAPDEFWARYQGHLRAWQWYAALKDDARVHSHDVSEAKMLVNATFDDVEQIAASYGARLPARR
jgi:hypothetical protein